MSKILVFGATGTLGECVSRSLVKRNVPFKAVVRSKQSEKANKLKELSSNLELVEADLSNPSTITAALEGVETVFYLTPLGLTTAFAHNFVSAASKSNVKYVVKLSTAACEDPKNIWGMEHVDVEKQITKAGLKCISLRPTAFSTNLFGDLQGIKSENKIYAVQGTASTNYIAPHDIGEAAAVVLMNPAPHVGKEYRLSGPDSVTAADIASIFTELLGRKIEVVDIDDATFRIIGSYFLPPSQLDAWSNMAQRIKEIHPFYAKKSSDLKNLIGNDGQGLKEWLASGPIYAFK